MYLISMDLMDAFWCLVVEAGSSAEEFVKLEVSVSFSKENSTVNIYKVSCDAPEAKLQSVEYNFQVLFDNIEIDLHDPESLNKLKDYLQKIKSSPADRKTLAQVTDLIDGPVELGPNPRGLGTINGESLEDRAKAKFGWHWRSIEPDND